MKHLTMLIVLLCCTLITLPASATDDKSVTVEFIWGIGGTTAHKGFVLRAGRDNIEVHVAHWFGARSNTALGVGLTARTEKDGQRGNEFFHASGTAGLSYLFKTNSIFSNHLQPYFRVAVGSDINSGGNTEVEFSYSRYGFEVAEQFVGLGLRINDRYQGPEADNTTTSSKPDDDEDEGDDGDNDDDDGNNGHGDDDDGCDESNPGNSGCGGSDDNDDSDDGDNDDGDNDDDSDNDDDDYDNGDYDDDSDDDSDNGDNDDDGNNGHGNDDNGCDESNPGNGGPPSCDDDS